jgi:hypothetical protein
VAARSRKTGVVSDLLREDKAVGDFPLPDLIIAAPVGEPGATALRKPTCLAEVTPASRSKGSP